MKVSKCNLIWRVTLHSGREINANEMSYRLLDFDSIKSFQIGKFFTSSPPAAYRCREFIHQGKNYSEFVHIIVMPGEIIFIEDKDGTITRQPGFTKGRYSEFKWQPIELDRLQRSRL